MSLDKRLDELEDNECNMQTITDLDENITQLIQVNQAEDKRTINVHQYQYMVHYTPDKVPVQLWIR